MFPPLVKTLFDGRAALTTESVLRRRSGEASHGISSRIDPLKLGSRNSAHEGGEGDQEEEEQGERKKFPVDK